jgi:dTMP kinase
LVDFLRSLGFTVYATREPGGTTIGEQIREVLHDLKNSDMHPRAETLLYQAARAQFVEQVIKQRLSDKTIVISDRYIDSTLAYQGYGHRQKLDEIKALINYATGGLIPDLTILLDLNVEIGLNRKANGDEWNRLDAFTIEFHQRVRAGYLELAREEPSRWVKVDASQSWKIVQESIRNTILDRINSEKHRT